MDALPPPPIAPGPGWAHVALAATLSSALTGAILVLTLSGRSQELGGQVERSVRQGIADGVDHALTPARLQDRSAAAGRGLVDGLVDGALDQVAPARADAALERALEGAVHAGGRALELGLGVAGAPRLDPAPRGEAAPVGSRAPGSAGEAAGRLVGEAADLGFDLLDEALGAPRDRR